MIRSAHQGCLSGRQYRGPEEYRPRAVVLRVDPERDADFKLIIVFQSDTRLPVETQKLHVRGRNSCHVVDNGMSARSPSQHNHQPGHACGEQHDGRPNAEHSVPCRHSMDRVSIYQGEVASMLAAC